MEAGGCGQQGKGFVDAPTTAGQPALSAHGGGIGFVQPEAGLAGAEWRSGLPRRLKPAVLAEVKPALNGRGCDPLRQRPGYGFFTHPLVGNVIEHGAGGEFGFVEARGKLETGGEAELPEQGRVGLRLGKVAAVGVAAHRVGVEADAVVLVGGAPVGSDSDPFKQSADLEIVLQTGAADRVALDGEQRSKATQFQGVAADAGSKFKDASRWKTLVK